MSKVRNQVTCQCGAYDFPHRIGGGNCGGYDWCESYRQLDSSMCDSCNCFNGTECEAATGQEDFKNGDCYQQELRLHWMKSEYGNLPVNIEDILQQQYDSYYGER